MSKTACGVSIITALLKAEDIIGANRQWETSGDSEKKRRQQQLISLFNTYRKDVEEDAGGIKRNIKSIASWKAEEINKFLRDYGFLIQLQPFDSLTFGVASIMDVLVEWYETGEVNVVKHADKKRSFPGVQIGRRNVSFYEAVHDSPIVKLATKSDDFVCITMCDNPSDGLELLSLAQKLTKNMSLSAKFNGEFHGAIFPMVDLNKEEDIGWLLGLNTTGKEGEPETITQALQQNKLRMNEKGARAESATAMGITRGCSLKSKPPHIINRPFLVWFVRKGFELPLFAAYVTEDDWKNPGDIRNK